MDMVDSLERLCQQTFKQGVDVVQELVQLAVNSAELALHVGQEINHDIEFFARILHIRCSLLEGSVVQLWSKKSIRTDKKEKHQKRRGNKIM